MNLGKEELPPPPSKQVQAVVPFERTGKQLERAWVLRRPSVGKKSGSMGEGGLFWGKGNQAQVSPINI